LTFTIEGIPAHVLVDRAGLRGEGLVGLDEVEVVDDQPAFSSALREAGIGPVPMIADRRRRSPRRRCAPAA
jgi:hypothetical protein